MKTIRFTRIGEPVSDFSIEDKLYMFMRSENESWDVANMGVIEAVLALMAEGAIRFDEITITSEAMNGEFIPLEIDERGRVQRPYLSSEIIISTLVQRRIRAQQRQPRFVVNF